MSRHRNYRNYQYEDDMSDDVYGHSVEDHDICVSPTTAEQFMFRRSNSREPNLSSYMMDKFDSVEEEESEEELLASSQDYIRPKLDPESEAKLLSCLDQMHSILGDSCHEPTAVDAILRHNFDLEKAIDQVLGGDSSWDQAANTGSRKGTEVDRPRESFPYKPQVAANRSRACEPPVQLGLLAADGGPGLPPLKISAARESAVVGFASPVLDSKKSRESSPELPNGVETNRTRSPEASGGKPAARGVDEATALKEYEERHQGKALLNLVVIGHVDAGKSTLMGHLLYLLGDVSKKSMHKYEIESKKAGKASFAYAWVLDETGEERERGITMDVGLTRFETKTKLITLMDAPGHKDFIPNMITGAAQADVAILVVGASTGEFEAGFDAGGQTREHALLVRSLGVTQIIVAVNKLDNVDWSGDRYNHIVNKLKQFLKQVGFKESDVMYVPCSGLSGENLTNPAKESKLVQWYKGPCLLERIDDFKPPKRVLDKPFRFCVADVYKGIGTGLTAAGKVEAGRVKNGDKILIMPSGEQGLVKAMGIHDEPVQMSCAGDHVTMTLSGLDMMHVGVGSVVCCPRSPIKCTTRLRARIIVFNIKVPITKGFMVLFHYQTLSEPATIKRLLSVLHKTTGEVLQKKPRCLVKNSNADVEIHTSKPVCIELYKDYKDLGRFMLRYGGETMAAGVVTEIL